jgi:hypothetical protein
VSTVNLAGGYVKIGVHGEVPAVGARNSSTDLMCHLLCLGAPHIIRVAYRILLTRDRSWWMARTSKLRL